MFKMFPSVLQILMLTQLGVAVEAYTENEAVTKDTAPILSVEKECRGEMTTVGRLEWRVWRSGDMMVARCDLHKTTPRMAFAISWTSSRDNIRTKEVLGSCDAGNVQMDEEDSVFCQYSVRLRKNETGFRDGHKIVCWVKAVGAWSEDSAAACSSDDIDLAEIAYTLAREEKETKVMHPMELTRSLNLLPPLTYNDNLPTPPNGSHWVFGKNATEPYGHFLLDLDGNFTNKICPADPSNNFSSAYELTVAVYERLDLSPPALTYGCRATFEDMKYSGNFTVSMYRKNVSLLYNSIVAPMKSCYRSTLRFYRPLVCEITLAINMLDIGSSVFRCIAQEIPLDNTRSEPCLSAEVSYNITLDKRYLPKVEKIPLVFKAGRTNRGATRLLPWDTDPAGGPGVRLNGVQFMVMSTGTVTSLMTLGCCFFGVRAIRSKKQENLDSHPCDCATKSRL